jgi:hypothetical protein
VAVAGGGAVVPVEAEVSVEVTGVWVCVTGAWAWVTGVCVCVTGVSATGVWVCVCAAPGTLEMVCGSGVVVVGVTGGVVVPSVVAPAGSVGRTAVDASPWEGMFVAAWEPPMRLPSAPR